jgi:hypothetical protein
VAVTSLISPPWLRLRLLDLCLFAAHRFGDPLGILDLALLQGDFLPDYRGLLHPNFLLHQRDPDLLAFIDVSVGFLSSGSRASIDHDFFPRDGNLDRPLFAYNFFPKPNLTGLNPLLLGPELLLAKLHAGRLIDIGPAEVTVG